MVPKRVTLIDVSKHGFPENSGAVENKQKYADLNTNNIENWASLRDEILRTAVKRNLPSVDFCLKFGCDGLGQHGPADDEGTQDIIFRCKDCGPFYFVCYSCLLDDHILCPNHIPDGWKVCC